jgi:hypothetical protein
MDLANYLRMRPGAKECTSLYPESHLPDLSRDVDNRELPRYLKIYVGDVSIEFQRVEQESLHFLFLMRIRLKPVPISWPYIY